MLPELESIAEQLKRDLKNQIIVGSVLLDRLSVIDELTRKTPAYLDHKFAPFYYYLGKYFKSQNLMEVGFNLGFFSACYLKSCKTVENFLGFQKTQKEYYSMRLGKANIRKNYKGISNFYYGDLFDQEFLMYFGKNPWEVVLLNLETTYDEHLEYLDFIYPSLASGGLIVVDFYDHHKPNKDAIDAFAISKNRQLHYFNTRYGVAIIQK